MRSVLDRLLSLASVGVSLVLLLTFWQALSRGSAHTFTERTASSPSDLAAAPQQPGAADQPAEIGALPAGEQAPIWADARVAGPAGQQVRTTTVAGASTSATNSTSSPLPTSASAATSTTGSTTTSSATPVTSSATGVTTTSPARQAVSTPKCQDLSKPDGGTWRCTFDDEFDGSTLDPAKWQVVSNAAQGWGWGNGCFVDDGQHVVVSGGSLSLIADRANWFDCATPLENDGTSTQYRTGAVKTLGRFSQLYGRFEMRAKLPAGRGMWPAFWLMPETRAYGGWPRSGEIDVMEALGHDTGTAYATQHYLTAADGRDANDEYACPVRPNYSNDFHTYALDWTPTAMTISYDDVVCHTFTGWASDLGGTKPYDQPFFMILDLAVGGHWPGEPDAGTSFPASFTIDYIRAWQ